MITALDTSVALDILLPDSEFAGRSMEAFRRARAEGQVIVCEMVVAEITPVLPRPTDFSTLATDWSLRYVSCGEEAALLAGRWFRSYLQRDGKRGRIVADLIIGAPAACHADRLLSRDAGFQRQSVPDLSIWYS